MWVRIASFILRNRVSLLIVLGAITVFMGYQASKIELEYEYAQMLPEEDSTYIEFLEFKHLFGEDANIMAVGFQDSNFFQVAKYNAWRTMQDSIKQLDGILQVATISDAFKLSRNTELKKFELEKIFPKQVSSQLELDSLKELLYTLPFYEGVVYNKKSAFYLLGITIKSEKINSKQRIPLVDSLQSYTEHFSKQFGVKMHYSGLPYTRTRIAEKIKKELNLFVILALMVTALILFVFFRSLKVVLYSMLVVTVGVMWGMGTIVLLGYKITILTGLIPPLLIVIGVPNCVFLLNKYHNEYKKHNNQIKALQRIIYRIGNATFLTNLTTASGFATFIVTNNRILVEFGIVASLTIFGIFLLSLILIPVIFSFVPPPSEKHTRHLDNQLISKSVDTLIRITTNHRPKLYISTLALLIACVFGISLMKSTGYIIDDIPKDDPIYRDLKFFEQHIGGVMPLEISIDTQKPKGAVNLKTIKKIDQFQTILKEKYPEVSPPVSIANAVKFATQAYYNGNEAHYRLPSNMEQGFILSYAMKDKNKTNMLKSFIDSTGQYTRVSLRVKDIGTIKMGELKDSLEMELNRLFPAPKYKTSVTGSSIVFTQGTAYLLKNLFVSLGLAIVLISLFMAWMFSSARMVFISIIPNLLPLLFTAAIMGYLGISVKPSTVLVFSIAFGISVDNAIHFLAKYRQELIISQWDIKKSVLNALKETGVSIMYTVIILFFGFSIFIASSFGGTKALGSLISVTLLVAMMSNLILLPSLLLTLEKRITTRAFKESMMHLFDEDEDIELEKLTIEQVKKDEDL